MQRVRNAQCPCCDSRESEMIQQMLFECKAPEEERERTEDTQWSTSQRLALFAPRPQASQKRHSSYGMGPYIMIRPCRNSRYTRGC